ncbi:xanthine dehydrogenase accessory protein XdhC [Defluviimonas sp. SAOS-178_SWC]|uniref:xanthine dehydrogenase accessory protein XdhC n=1 Tax=Defluviimonas sp. SAOS-178_SWC TaxID=3121287 RepID=UPI00322144B9
MSFDLQALARAVAREGRVARVVIANRAGSTPREAGTAMLVWATGQEGTIGGGALEYEAAKQARAALATGDRLDKVPLGPNIGQCCGGAVLLLTEIWDTERIRGIEDAVVRPMPGFDGEAPLKVVKRLRAARNGTRTLVAEAIQGWMIEPLTVPARELWIWGAGHVGRALVAVLAPLPGLRVTWIDTDAGRFPDTVPDGIVQHVAANPADLVAGAPAQAEHLILTFSHALDLELCHRLLSHGFGSAGLIGSETKWARFRSRLRALDHSDAQISRIRCPIGDPGLGKHPQAIAIGVAADLLKDKSARHNNEERAG